MKKTEHQKQERQRADLAAAIQNVSKELQVQSAAGSLPVKRPVRRIRPRGLRITVIDI